MSEDDASKAHYSSSLAFGVTSFSPRRDQSLACSGYTWPVSLIKSVSTVSLWTLASRITGLVRETMIASIFGVSAMTDAFNVAFRIPNLFRRLFAEGAFSQAFVPVLAAARAQQGDEATKLLIDKVATLLAWVLVATCIVGVLLAPWMVWAMASGLQKNPQGYSAAVVMTRFMFPYIGFMSMVALASGVLNTWRRFAVPAATPVLLNVAMISAAWLLAPWLKTQGIEPIYAMAVGVMVGGTLQLGIQVPVLRRMGLLPNISLRWAGVRAAWADPGNQRIATLMLPALFGVSVAQISLLINTQIASHLTTGSVTWLSNADRLMEFPIGMLGVALGVVLMPRLASSKAGGNTQEYSDLLDWGLRIVVLLSVPCALALLIFAKPLVAVLYHYGAYTELDVRQTSLALMGWGAGLLGIVSIKVLAPGYYASQDIKTPVRIAVVVLLITQLLNVALVPVLKHAGLSLSIGIGAMINATWLLVGLIRRKSYAPKPGWGIFVLQVLAGSALLMIYLLWADSAFPWMELRSESLKRAALLGLLIVGAGVLYLSAVWGAGLKPRQFLRRE